MLRKHHIAFSEHPYAYQEHGGTSVSAHALGVPEHELPVRLHGMDSVVKAHVGRLSTNFANVHRRAVFDELIGTFFHTVSPFVE